MKWSLRDDAQDFTDDGPHYQWQSVEGSNTSALMLMDVDGEPYDHWAGSYPELHAWFCDPAETAYCISTGTTYVTLLIKMRKRSE